MFERLRRMGVDSWLAAANLAVTLAIGVAVVGARPLRTAWVEVPAAAVGALLVASAGGLASRARWAPAVTRAAGLALLAGGLAALASALLGLVFYRAVAGVGGGGPGPLMFLLVVLLALPYAVAYPVGLLLWLDGRGHRA
jgi:hypothetical protein